MVSMMQWLVPSSVLRSSLFCAALAAVLFPAAQAHAQVFKCVDAKGKTVYSQNPCPAGASSSVLGTKPAPARPDPNPKEPGKDDASKPAAKADPSKPATTAEKDQDFRKRQQERAEADKKAADQAAEVQRKQEDCRRAREQVAQYNIGGRIARLDEKGERYFLEDAQVEQEKAKWQAQADKACQ
jgi:hypothetical protein